MKQNKSVNSIINLKDIIISLSPLIIILIFEIFFKLLNNPLYLLTNNTNSLFFSILIGYSIYGIIIAFVKKTYFATIIFSILLFSLLIINQIKIFYTENPIYLTDILFLNQADNLLKFTFSSMYNILLKYYMFFLLVLILFTSIIVLQKKIDIALLNNTKHRIIIILVSCFIIIILFIPIPFLNDFYLNLFFNSKNKKDYDSYTTTYAFYLENTMLSGMYGTMLNNRFKEPDKYNEQNLDILLSSSKVSNDKSIDKPNIILLFSESFYNLDNISEFSFNKDVTPNYKELSQKYATIDLLSCSYGGMSENVAFQLLTGGSLNYFSDSYIPIMSLYQRNNSNNISSIIKELEKNDYFSKITFGVDCYNSEKAFKKIGFNEYVELSKTIPNCDHSSISDESMINFLISDLKNKPTNKKSFYMIETFQNHMPYYSDKYKKYDISISQSSLSKEDQDVILSYAQGLYAADQQLKKLYEFIENYNEPTLVVFLGDHLPYLYSNGKNIIDDLNYFNTQDSLLNTYRKYSTQALVFSNYDINYTDFPKTLSTDLLLTYLINNMDIKISDYYKWLYSTISYLPACNKYVSLDKANNLYSTNSINDEMKRIYLLKEQMQYRFFIKPTLK